MIFVLKTKVRTIKLNKLIKWTTKGKNRKNAVIQIKVCK